MPVPPPSANIYDSANSILDASRARVAQSMPSLTAYMGNLLDYTQANTQQMFNNAWRRFQDALCDAGSKKFYAEILIEDIPPTATYDPAVMNSISWFECSDGVNTTTTPVLPSDLVTPLSISERLAGSDSEFPPPETPNMGIYLSGLPKTQKFPFNGAWEWRGEVIYYPGATQSVDFLIWYRKNLADIVDVGNQRWFNQSVPLVRCQDPLSWWTVCEIATAEAAKRNAPRGVAQLAAMAKVEAMEATKKYVNRDVMLDEYTEARRIPYGSGGGFGNGRWR